MKRTILSLIIVGMFASAGTAVLADDSKMSNQPAGTTQDKTQRENSKAEHMAAQDKVNAQFKEAKAKCDQMQGDAMRSCLSDAKSAQTKGLAQAKATWELQGKAKDKESNASPRPGSVNSAQVGGSPDTKATTGQSAANSNQATPKARADGAASNSKADYIAATDKAQVDYTDAKAKCDALQSDAKGSCISNAKSAQNTAMAIALTEWQSQDGASRSDGDAMERSSKGMKGEGGMKPDADSQPDGATQPDAK